MTDIIQGVFDFSEEVLTKEPFHVKINNEKVEELGKQMIDSGPISFYNDEEKEEYKTRLSHKALIELVASSINYCYWYGSHKIRPNNVSSTTMYEDVNKALGNGYSALMFEKRIKHLIEILAHNRYPLLEERKRHLLDLCEDRKAEHFIQAVVSKDFSGERLFYELIERFTGFASDIFLKRASLFFIQLYRNFGWYEDLIQKIFIPADYQVPKILRHFECFEYSDLLSHEIDNCILIKKHSLKEIQIRAATIKICKQLQDITGWNASDIDTWLWTKRKMTDKPFHLTVTYDY